MSARVPTAHQSPQTLAEPPALKWSGPEYPRVAPGRYQALCTGYQGPQWVRAYRRWSLRLEFELLDSNKTVSAFFNFGNDANNARIGRRSKYFRAWTLANGELPRKEQAMSADIFRNGQLFLVEVKDKITNADGSDKADSEAYSYISDIVSVELQLPTSHNQAINQSSSTKVESLNQISSNHTIRNQPIKFGQPSGRAAERPKAPPVAGRGNKSHHTTQSAGTPVSAQATPDSGTPAYANVLASTLQRQIGQQHPAETQTLDDYEATERAAIVGETETNGNVSFSLASGAEQFDSGEFDWSNIVGSLSQRLMQ